MLKKNKNGARREGSAAAEVLFGDVNPSGRLPFTIAHADDAMALRRAQFPGDALDVKYSEGLDVGYRWYAKRAESTRHNYMGHNYIGHNHTGHR